MNIALIVIAALALVVALLALLWAGRRRAAAPDARISLLQEQIERVNRSIGEVAEASRQAQKVEESLQRFQDLLRAPKPRGQLGELLLENLLKEVLPGHYVLQYAFADGKKVDACLRLADGLVPVDAKFPLEAFERMLEAPDEVQRQRHRNEFLRRVRAHMEAVAKYIRPDEGTLNFALMYIPAENVYYETIAQGTAEEGLLLYALQKRVIPVSPASFYAYLQAILLGLQGLRLQENVRTVLESLQRLQEELRLFDRDFETLGEHLRRAAAKYGEAAQKVERLGHRLDASLQASRQASPSGEGTRQSEGR